MAKMKSFFRSQEHQAISMALTNIQVLAQTGNKKLIELARAASIAKAIMNTAEGITKAMTMPFPLSVALAATTAAAGAVQVGVISGVKFKDGGMFEGGIPGVDSIPAVVQRNEVIAPARNFEEVIGSVRAKREAEELGGTLGGPNQVEIMVSYDSPEASQIITVGQVEDTALGISQDSFKEAG